jgi:hypothetical protein
VTCEAARAAVHSPPLPALAAVAFRGLPWSLHLPEEPGLWVRVVEAAAEAVSAGVLRDRMPVGAGRLEGLATGLAALLEHATMRCSEGRPRSFYLFPFLKPFV